MRFNKTLECWEKSPFLQYLKIFSPAPNKRSTQHCW